MERNGLTWLQPAQSESATRRTACGEPLDALLMVGINVRFFFHSSPSSSACARPSAGLDSRRTAPG